MAETATATKTSSDKAPAAPQAAAPPKVAAGGPTMQGMSPQEMQQRFGNAAAGSFVVNEVERSGDVEMRLSGGLADRFERRLGQPVEQARINVGPIANRRAIKHGSSAVTIGDAIYFRTGKLSAESIEGLALLAHELVHVIQQTGERSTLKPGTDAEAEVEAEKLSLPTNDSTEPVRLMRPIGPQGLPGVGVIKSAGGAIKDAAVDSANVVGDAATGAYNWSEEQLEKGVEYLINQVAPGLIDLLKDPIGKAKELLWEAADTVIAGLLDTLNVVDIATWLQEKLTSSKSFAETFDGSMGEGALDTLGTILESAMDFIGTYGVSFLEMLQGKIDDIRGPLEDAWARIGKPVADFLGEAGGAAWSAITGTISSLWSLFSKVLGAVGGAGSWLMDQFGINWGGGDGNGETDAKNWFMGFVDDAWATLKEGFTTQFEPVVAIYEALKELWEMKEVQAVVNSMQGFWNQAKTMVDKWSADDMMVQFRETLQETVLPPVMAFLDGFGELVTGALNWLGEKVALLVAPIILLVEKVVGHEKLTKVSAIAAQLVVQLVLFAAWALNGFPNVIGIFQSGLDKLKGALQTVVDFLIDFAFAVINPIVGIPGFLLGTLWQAIPDRFKPPILTFVVNLLKTFVMAFGVLGGPLTLVLSDAIVGFLDVILESSDELKIAASNRIADLLVGSAEFAVGFFLGLLRGIWQAFSDPFIMLYDLIKALYGVASFMVEWLDSLGPNGGDSDVTMRRVDVDQSNAAAPDQAAVVNDAVAQAEATAESGGESGGGLFSKKTNFVPAPGIDQDALGTHGEAGAEEEPELTLEQRLADSDGDAQSAIIREIYGPSAETEEGLRAGKTSGETKEQEVNESETQASGPESASEDGLSSLLGEAWGAITEAAVGLGRSMGEKFFEFLGLGDREIGDKIGWLTGTVLFEIVINYLTAGGAGALKISSKTVKAIIAIIDMGGTIFNGLFKLVGKLGASGIRAALKGVRSVLQQIPGMGAAVDWIDNVLETVFKHGDEVAENTAKHADEASEQSARQADEAAENSAKRGDDAGDQAGRQADEAGGQAGRQADQVTQRAAIAEARLITEAAEKAGIPVNAVVATLNSVVKPRYPQIGTFKSRPKPGDPGAFKIFLNPPVDNDYDPEVSTGNEATPEPKSKSTTPGPKLPTPMPKTPKDIPTFKSGRFNAWFDGLPAARLKTLYEDKRFRQKIKKGLRGSGGQHEFLKVAEAPHWKKWGVSAKEVQEDFAIPIKDLNEGGLAKGWKHSTGLKGSKAPGSPAAHDELEKVIKASDDLTEFKDNMKAWAEEWIEGGYDSLPSGFQ